jgi:hypothetical protein
MSFVSIHNDVDGLDDADEHDAKELLILMVHHWL